MNCVTSSARSPLIIIFPPTIAGSRSPSHCDRNGHIGCRLIQRGRRSDLRLHPVVQTLTEPPSQAAGAVRAMVARRVWRAAAIWLSLNAHRPSRAYRNGRRPMFHALLSRARNFMLGGTMLAALCRYSALIFLCRGWGQCKPIISDFATTACRRLQTPALDGMEKGSTPPTNHCGESGVRCWISQAASDDSGRRSCLQRC